MKAKELREKTDEELQHFIAERTDDLLHYRVQAATGVVDNVRAAREARKDIARTKTILTERNASGDTS